MKSLLKNISLILLLSSASLANAQVTIGSGIAPNQGVLLDLKELNDLTAQGGGRTSDKGFLFPRVVLTTLNSLVDIPEANQQLTPLRYAGLTVYNTDNTRASQGLYQGLNVWDGTKWNSIKSYIKASMPKTLIKASGGSSMSLVDISLLNNWQKMVFTQEEFDENNEYDNTPSTGGQFIPAQDGVYEIYAQYSFKSLLTASDIGVGIFKKNTTGNTYSLIANSTSLGVGLLGGTITRSVQTMLNLKAGDTIIVAAYATVSLTLIGGTSSYVTIQQIR